ncbi:MAG: carbohydrate binding family 9 domain-containing protein, partial [Bacteroidota bacterium]
MLRKILVLLIVLCMSISLQAQSLTLSDIPEGAPQLSIKKATDKITLDGALDEASWAKAERTTDFWQYFPTDTVLATEQSIIKMTYDDQFLYIGIVCSSTVGNDWIITSLRRDFRGGNNDGISFLLDPFANQTNAFFFGLSPYGVRREALISNGGNDRG